MKIQALVLSGLGSVGLLGSCISNQATFENVKREQYAQIVKEKDIIDKYGYSTLKPNGKLSSIEGKDVLHFLTPSDSIAYENVNKLSNGLIKKVQVENQNRAEQLSNNYLNSKAATDGYYKPILKNNWNNGHFIDVYCDYKNTLTNIKQNNTILSKDARDTYMKQIKSAYKEGEQIRKYARKALGVVVRKMP